jgi:hypothetical protein
MVAYSFNTAFVRQVETLAKRQTVRLPRKRHARPGEPVQLYAGMRTKHCRKLVDPDPVCIGVDEIVIRPAEHPLFVEVNGMPLAGDDLEAFCSADGFDPTRFPTAAKSGVKASALFARWWLAIHEQPVFHGVVIRWEPQGR